MKWIISLAMTLFTLSAIAQNTELVQAANNFLKTLTPDLKAKAQYPMDDKERFNWGFVPRERNGPTFHDFNEEQKAAAMALLKVSLSSQGYQKATNAFVLEKILQGVEGKPENDPYRDPLNFHFTIFGTPAADKAWGWRLEGHHMSWNFAASSGEIVSSTPSFLGSNPGVVPSGKDKGWQALKNETEMGFALVNSLTEAQKKKAMISDVALPEIVTSNNVRATSLDPKGVPYSDLTADQKKQLMQLLDVYVGNYVFGFSSKLMDKIKKAGIENLSFAWAGSLKPGAGHYYRIQGPMLLIEYDNTQNNANHVHTAVRDLTNDFAEDILREHYLKEHK